MSQSYSRPNVERFFETRCSATLTDVCEIDRFQTAKVASKVTHRYCH